MIGIPDDPYLQGNGMNGHTRRGSFDSHSPQRFGWEGTCVHDFETPRWVQKQKQVDPEDSRERAYHEPRRAVTIAVNGKFSLIAVGTEGSVSLRPPITSVFDTNSSIVSNIVA